MTMDSWFDSLQTVGLKREYAWLSQFSPVVENLVSIGCMSSEPFALMWTLDAHKLFVIEKDLDEFTKDDGTSVQQRQLERSVPTGLSGRSFEFIAGDVCHSPLPSEICDLAFCKDVLYFLQNDQSQVKAAVSEMVRMLRPGGLVIAVEPKYGVKFEKRHVTPFSGMTFELPIPVSDPEDISSFFLEAGLRPNTSYDLPDSTYCYSKPTF